MLSFFLLISFVFDFDMYYSINIHTTENYI